MISLHQVGLKHQESLLLEIILRKQATQGGQSSSGRSGTSRHSRKPAVKDHKIILGVMNIKTTKKPAVKDHEIVLRK